MKDDKTQTQLLNEIVNLLKPISELSKHYSRVLNDDVEKEKSISHLKITRTAEGEMKKQYD
tara:strand:- start:250 stop:432 length:183 start_codon:yes stop_codon:yes gene_type:complete